jgi:hypothetical protein
MAEGSIGGGGGTWWRRVQPAPAEAVVEQGLGVEAIQEHVASRGSGRLRRDAEALRWWAGELGRALGEEAARDAAGVGRGGGRERELVGRG